jgi:hypothetical protein
MGTRRFLYRHSGGEAGSQDWFARQICLSSMGERQKDTTSAQACLPKVSTEGVPKSDFDTEDMLTGPQMLQYYESHLVFTQSDGILNGGDDDDDESMKSV